ncbi:hypothetical protein Tco_0210042 [Tanacetum coccineum]
MDLDFAANWNLRELSGKEPWDAIENFAQGQKEWDNPRNIIFEQEVANLKARAKGLFRDENVLVEMHREYTPLVTYPEEVEETIGIPMEVEPLNETQLEDFGLNTRNHGSPFSSRGVLSLDEPKPQTQPLLNCPSLDVSLEERDPEPPIKLLSPHSFRMKVVDLLTIHTSPLPHVAYLYPKDTYCYYHPCLGYLKKHYGFKPGLLGQGGSIGVDFSNMEMIENDWELESKEIYFLGRGINSPVGPKEVEYVGIKETHHLEHIIQQPIFQHVIFSHNNDVYRYYHPHLNSSVGGPSPLSVKQG